MAPVTNKDFCEKHLRSSPYGALRKPHEEDNRPWGGQAAVVDKPLLRIWDRSSDSTPDESSCLKANCPQEYLHSRQARRNALTSHVADRSQWGRPSTPFISFQTKDLKTPHMAGFWSKIEARGTRYLTVINPNVRAANGLPTLNLLEEMNYYGASWPSRPGSGDSWYGEQYICLWQVTPAEVVGTWVWDNLREDEDWYKNIVYPAFLAHDREACERDMHDLCLGDLEKALLGGVDDGQKLKSETNLESIWHIDCNENAAHTSGADGKWEVLSEGSSSEVETEIDSDVEDEAKNG